MGAEDMMVILHVFARKLPKVGFHREGNVDVDFRVLILQNEKSRDLFTFGAQVKS